MGKKEVVTIISNDWHINSDNTNEIINVVRDKVILANSLGIKMVFAIGDIFQSRQAQPLKVLKCFEEILDIFGDSQIKLVVIPGNHDKTSYESKNSFLDSFSYHPALFLMREADCIDLNKINFILIPYFTNEVWLKELEFAKKYIDIGEYNQNILLSHISMSGSVNNDGTKVSDGISPKLLKDFDAVYLGHYHNFHKVSGEVYHLPSIRQNNFGEDDNKGFTLVYSDGSFEIKRSNFKQFKTVEINLEEIEKGGLKELISSLEPNEHFTRLKLKGPEDLLKGVKIDELKALGFDVKTEQKDITDSIEDIREGNVTNFDESSILKEFEVFCEKEGYEDFDFGFMFLKKGLKV